MYYKKILAAALTVSCIGGIVPANSVQAALTVSCYWCYGDLRCGNKPDGTKPWNDLSCCSRYFLLDHEYHCIKSILSH